MTVKRWTRYEQVPIAVAKKIARREARQVISKPILVVNENPAASVRAV